MSSAPLSGPPTANRPTILRPRLLAVLQYRFERRLTALVAGPGFGKSTLLAQAVAENALSPRGTDVWHSCSPDDAAVSVLASGITAALRTAEAGGHGMGAAAGDAADVSGAAAVEPRAAAREIADAVWSRAPAQVAIVLDDAHVVPRGSPGAQLLLALTDVLPRNGHVVAASRPPLSLHTARLLANGDAVRLGEEDLAFAEHELSAFAAQRRVAPELLRGFGGWPALAELTATAGRHSVADYLWEELLETIPEEHRDLLAALVAVGGADDELARALRGSPTDLAQVLDGLPLVSSTPGGWWTLHPLWATALRGRLEDPFVAGARRTAAMVLRQRGRVRDSMRLLLQVEAWDDVRDLIVDVCSPLTPALPADVLSRWQDELPPALHRSPEGRLLAGAVAKAVDPTSAGGHFRAAAAGFRAARRPAEELGCLLSLFHLSFWDNDLPGMSAVLDRWGELGAEGSADARALRQLGQALLTADPSVAEAALAAVPRSVSAMLVPTVDWLRAHILLLSVGDPAQAAAWAQRALPRAAPTLRSTVRCELVESLRLLGRLAEAEQEIPRLLDDMETAVVRSPRQLSTAVVLLAFLGQVDRAGDLLPRLRESVALSHLPWAPIAGAVAAAAHAVADGDEDGARERLRQVFGHRMAHGRVLLRVSPAALPLSYALMPESRASWDATELRGCFCVSYLLARCLVAVREGGSASLSGPDAPAPELVPAHLPLPWVVELAVGAEAGLVTAPPGYGRRLVDGLGPRARPALRALAESPEPRTARQARALLAATPPAAAHRLRICVLGPMTLLRDGEPVAPPDLRRERVRQLLGYLVVHRRVARASVAALLWPDLEEAVAARNLRVTLNYLQGVLEPDRDEHDRPYFLRSSGNVLHLADDDMLEVDAWEFDECLAEAGRAERQAVPSLAVPAYRRATDLYAGDLLADLPQVEWAAYERDGMRTRFLAAAVRTGNLVLAQGEHAEARSLAARALAVEPWSEPAHRLLVDSLLAAGDPGGARRALARCHAMLDELGVAPSEEILAVARRLRPRGEAPGPAARPGRAATPGR